MSRNQARKLREQLIPVKNHPHGRTLCSMYKALLVEKDGRGVIHDGILHWFNFRTHDTERGHFGSTCGELRVVTGAEGHVGVQLEQGNG